MCFSTYFQEVTIRNSLSYKHLTQIKQENLSPLEGSVYMKWLGWWGNGETPMGEGTR